MFILTQLIGILVAQFYFTHALPYGLNSSISQTQASAPSFISIILAFILAIAIFFVLIKFKVKTAIRIWFFAVIIIALGVSFSVFLFQIFGNSFKILSLFALVLALPIALSKIYSRNILSHNISELFIYPGIAILFIPLLNVLYLSILLVLISLYYMWAVLRSGIMQKMAKYQMKELKVFSGFFVPYLTAEQRKRMTIAKKSGSKDKKIKVNVAILGGGDVVFPIIASGVLMKVFNNVWAPLIVVAGALLGLGLLLIFSQKKKFYPAMPFISIGIFIAIGVCYLVF